MKALVVGGGIGGLAAALSLHEAGVDVDVYESVKELRPLGVGINLLPHAVRELYELGLKPAIADAGVMPSQLVYYSKRGERIWGEPRGMAAGYRWPQISIHRGRLHMLLHDVVRERLGASKVHLGHHLEAFNATRNGVSCRFVDRPSGAPLRSAEGDFLVGCDGIHSAVRARLYPGEGGPAWNGALMWRGVTSSSPFLDGQSMIMAGHADQKFVAYPIGTTPSGRAAINWVAEIHYPATHPVEPEDWNRAGRLADFLPAFRDWRFGWLDVPDLVTRADAIYVYPMVDRDPLPRWGHDRVTLLGDAAHPMYPIGSNGASQAILDACVLVGCLRSHADPSVALSVYEEIRRPATAAIVLANRKQGPEECMTLVEQRAPDGFRDVEDVVSLEELAAIADKYKRLCGFSVHELNDSPSLRHAAIDSPALALAPLLSIRASLGPIVSVGQTPRGHVRMVAILGGAFEGAEARGRILPGGADWQEVRPDGVLEIRAHYLLETDDGAAIEVHSEGLRAASPEVLARIERGERVTPSEYYFRTAIRLTTASARLNRFNNLLGVAHGQRQASDVLISVFEVL